MGKQRDVEGVIINRSDIPCNSAISDWGLACRSQHGLRDHSL